MRRVLVIGGYGVFGGLLAARLTAEDVADVWVAGRTLKRAERFCAIHGGIPLVVDRSDPSALMSAFRHVQPDIVIDASGPFDMTGVKSAYHVAEAAIRCGAHYVDLADDADFVATITRLDKLARSHGVAVISGASSVPALSSAAIDELSRSMQKIASIETAILPGNRAPRGLAVIRSILGQAGRPFREWRNGGWQPVICWGDIETLTLHVPGCTPVQRRWSSPIRVPDTELLAGHYKAETVIFRAGLELRILHAGLYLMSFLPRIGLVRSLRPFAKTVHHIAQWFEAAGSDRGGMVVTVTGFGSDNRETTRRWTLLAEEGTGPNVPTIAAYVLARKLIAGGVETGARPALGVVSLKEAEEAMAPFAIHCCIETLGEPAARNQSLRTITEPAE